MSIEKQLRSIGNIIFILLGIFIGYYSKSTLLFPFLFIGCVVIKDLYLFFKDSDRSHIYGIELSLSYLIGRVLIYYVK